MRKTKVFLFALIIMILSASMLFASCNSAEGNAGDSPANADGTNNGVYVPRQYTSEEIYDMGKTCVAEILVYNKKNEEIALGSGFAISRDGQIVTNYHVIDDAYTIDVIINDITYDVTDIIAYDKNLDLAILQIPAENLTIMPTNKTLQSGGAQVYAIGSSEGYTLSFSSGTIASPERIFDNIKYIQHNASISHGNSGGPLVNSNGEIIGINTSTNPDGQNLNFAIAISEIDRLPSHSPMTMEEFYEEEGPYFEVEIGDYKVSESESNNTLARAQKISVNGTTIVGSVNKKSDFDYYALPKLAPGETLNIYMVPDYAADVNGILVGLLDSAKNVVAGGTKTNLDGLVMNELIYKNETSTNLTFYCVLTFSNDYSYKDTVAPYWLYVYIK